MKYTSHNLLDEWATDCSRLPKERNKRMIKLTFEMYCTFVTLFIPKQSLSLLFPYEFDNESEAKCRQNTVLFVLDIVIQILRNLD